MRLVTRGTAVWGIIALALTVWSCETTRHPGGIQTDVQPPAIILVNTVGDTQDIAGGLRFGIQAVDNLALKSVSLRFSGGLIAILDTNFTGQVKTYAVSRTLTFPSNSGAGGNIQVIGRATDGAGNFAEDTITIFLSNVQALRVRLALPSPGALASTGKGIAVDVIAVQNTGIEKIGFLVSPPTSVTNPTTPPSDSLVFTVPFADSVEYVDTLVVVPATGTFNIVGFAEDSAGRRGFTNVVSVVIQSVATDVQAPVVAHRIATRVEVDDTVHVRAQDPSAISWIGFRVDTGGVMMKFDSVYVGAGNLTDVTRHFTLGLQGLQPLPRCRRARLRLRRRHGPQLFRHQQHDTHPRCAGKDRQRGAAGGPTGHGADGPDRHRDRGLGSHAAAAVRRPDRGRDLQRQRLEPLSHQSAARPCRGLPGREHIVRRRGNPDRWTAAMGYRPVAARYAGQLQRHDHRGELRRCRAVDHRRPRRRAPPRVAPGPARLPDRNVSRVDGAPA